MQHPLAGWRDLSRPVRLYLLHSALLTAGLSIWGLFFNLSILSFGLGRDFLGLLNTSAMVAAVVLSLPLWALLGRIGLRNALLLQTLLWSGSALAFAVRPEAGPLLAAVAVYGAASVLLQIAAQPFMMQHSDPGSRDRVFSASAAIAILVGGAGSLAAGGLPALLATWLDVGPESPAAYRATFAVAAAVIALSALPLLLIDDRRPTTEESLDVQHSNDQRAPRSALRASLAIPAPWPTLIRRPWPVLRLLLTPFLVSWGAALLIPYLNLFFKERFALSDAALGAVFAGLGLATGLATLLGPALSARFGTMQTVVLSQALSLPFVLVLGFSPLFGVAAVAALARAALFNMGWPLYDAFAMAEVDERVRPALSGLLGGAASAGYILMPPLSVWIQARYGFEPIFVATAALYTLATALNYWMFVRRGGSQGAQPSLENPHA